MTKTEITKFQTNQLKVGRSQTDSSKPSLRDRIEAAKASGADKVVSGYNLIGLLLDQSSSMSGTPIKNLREAATAFVQACDFNDTAIRIETFPSTDTSTDDYSNNLLELTNTIRHIVPTGSTPMSKAMHNMTVIGERPTRCVMVSDGEPTDAGWEEYASVFGSEEIPIDAVFIGNAGDPGAGVMRTIAEITGGLFIRFESSEKLVQALKYLSPKLRPLLTTGDTKRLLGAEECS